MRKKVFNSKRILALLLTTVLVFSLFIAAPDVAEPEGKASAYDLMVFMELSVVIPFGGGNIVASINGAPAQSLPLLVEPTASVVMTAVPSPGQVLSEWTLNNNMPGFPPRSGNTWSFTMPNDNLVFIATFNMAPNPINYITVSSNNNSWGSAFANPTGAAQGSTISISASPVSGFRFVRWEAVSGGPSFANAASANTTFTMPNNAVSVRAVFEPIGQAVTVTTNNNALGSAYASPANASAGSSVSLTAYPNTGSRFVRWDVISGPSGFAIPNASSANTTFTMPSSAVTVRAVFEPAGLFVSVIRNVDTWGTAYANPSNATAGATVSLSAQPSSGAKFVRWEVVSGPSGFAIPNYTTANTRFTMPNTSVTVRAVFESTLYVTVLCNNNAWGTAYATPADAIAGATVTLTAYPSYGYRFVRWEVVTGPSGLSLQNATSPTTTFTRPTATVTVRAHFEPTSAVHPPPPPIGAGALTVSRTYVLLDGIPINLDVPPQMINGRAMVPMRAIFEALGATVNWSESTRTVTGTKGNTSIILVINNTTAIVNGQPVTLEQPAVTINSRTLVPLRFVGEALGVQVNWVG